jgi:hypothetical protein
LFLEKRKYRIKQEELEEKLGRMMKKISSVAVIQKGY